MFPLPSDPAVDGLVMTIGERRIIGQIKPRAETRAIYEVTRTAGHVASLLDQERPKIFMQSLTNIEPGTQVVIEVSYVETLRSDDGVFAFVFPMMVGPRYIPGSLSGKQGRGRAPDTTQMPDALRISPPVALPETHAGHDISGSWGTEMMPAIKEALGGRHDPTRLRIVAFMTDGYVGNDLKIIDTVRKHASQPASSPSASATPSTAFCWTAWRTLAAAPSNRSPYRARLTGL